LVPRARRASEPWPSRADRGGGRALPASHGRRLRASQPAPLALATSRAARRGAAHGHAAFGIASIVA
jgi:hypothetical protein